jgi:hypothetical protein
LIHINGRLPPANDCLAISWAGLRAELIFIKTPGLFVADKLLFRRTAMRTAIQDVFSRLARMLAALRWRPEFTCGDCERSDRCGLPPTNRCIAKAEQIARGDWTGKQRRATTLRQL